MVAGDRPSLFSCTASWLRNLCWRFSFLSWWQLFLVLVVDMPRRSSRLSVSAPPSPGGAPGVAKLKDEMDKMRKEYADEREESQLRMKLLEGKIKRQAKEAEKVVKEKGKKKKRDPSPSSDSSSESESDSSSVSSESDSSESDASRDCKSRRRKSKSKSKKKKCRASSHRLTSKLASRKWKTRSYEVQHELNAALLDTLRETRKSLKKLRGSRRAARRIKQGESLLSARQEWLAVADSHGHEAASWFQEGGEMLEIVSSSSKCKK